MPNRADKVLILSPNAMTAALVGWFVELATLQPMFAAPGEHPEAALARVKPVLVVLIDSEFDQALSDLLALRASRRGIGIAVFGSGRGNPDARQWAERNGVGFFEMPVDLETFCRALDQATRRGQADRRVADRRRNPAVDRALDGTVVLTDAAGRAWYVYDRRVGDRRLTAPGGARPYRAFVSDEGEERRCELSETEFSDQAPAALLAQLERAAQVPPNHS